MIICISGTPGTGKTTLAKSISKKIKCAYLDVNKIIQENNLEEGYDQKRKCKIIDTKKLSKILIKLIKENKRLIIDSHLSHYLPNKYIDLCIITKTDLKTLQKRLQKRKYPNTKIRENLDAEIFDVCLTEAREFKHKIAVVDTTKKVNIKKIIEKEKIK